MTGEEDSVGSVGEEAVKLLAALQEWARENGSDYAKAAAAAASGAAATASSVNEHIATGGKDCRYCPLCQLISAVRATSPEVRQHLTSAASALLRAAATAMATDVGRRQEDSPVEKIDLVDDAWDED